MSDERRLLHQQQLRDAFAQINGDFEKLLGDYGELINVGSALDAGDGDTLLGALEKVHRNLRLVKP
jgi:hypothetical protein